MKWPWSSEKIYCANEQELANLLIWLRNQSLSRMGDVHFQVVAQIPGLLSAQKNSRIVGYYVEVPSHYIQKRRDMLEPTMAMSDVLDGRA